MMKIIFPIQLYQKLRAYVESIDVEISGLGKIAVQPDGKTIMVEDLALLPQTATEANTVIKKGALGKFYNKIMQECPDDLVKWRMWWHSHGKMGVFWSGQDVATIEDFDTEMPDNNWLLSFETNHEAKVLTRIDIFEPIHCTLKDIPWDLDLANYGLMEEIKDEVTEKVELFLPRPSWLRPKKRKIYFPPVPISSSALGIGNDQIILPE